MTTLAIDPGPEKSAIVEWDGANILLAKIEPNEVVLSILENFPTGRRTPLAIEFVESYGTIVGQTVFETVYWVGRFSQMFGADDVHRVVRKKVRIHICGTARSGDADVRQMIIQRFGGSEKAIGKKKSPGPLFEITTHLWAALGLAITWHDQNPPQPVGEEVPQPPPDEPCMGDAGIAEDESAWIL